MEKDYMDFVKEQIELDKILAKTDSKYHKKIKELLNQKKKIINKNGLFANYKLNKINKQIEKYYK